MVKPQDHIGVRVPMQPPSGGCDRCGAYSEEPPSMKRKRLGYGEGNEWVCSQCRREVEAQNLRCLTVGEFVDDGTETLFQWPDIATATRMVSESPVADGPSPVRHRAAKRSDVARLVFDQNGLEVEVYQGLGSEARG